MTISWTRTEQETGAAVIRKWHRDEIMFVVNLPRRERELIVLAAALMNLAPGTPTDPKHTLELP